MKRGESWSEHDEFEDVAYVEECGHHLRPSSS
jgi:hypothetical protein